MKTYRIELVDGSNPMLTPELVMKAFKCDANALRWIATRLQHKTILTIRIFPYENRKWCRVAYW